MSFASLGLSAPLVAAVTAQGYETPSPIQSQAIPAVLQGKDMMAAAQTGTGKTAGFTLPLLERLIPGQRAKSNQVRALILTPTRELAAQVAESVATYGKNTNLRSAVVFGGVKINPQMQKLRGGVDILVATPGRLLDLYNQNAIRFNQLEILVLDEADRMLDMGFIHDIRKLIKLMPVNRQNLLFSATFSEEIRQLAATITRNPVEISVSPRNTAAGSVEQLIYSVDKARKSALLSHLIIEQNWTQVLVFSRTKHGADKLSRYLEKNGIQSAAIHGNKAQGARTRALAGFKNGNLQVLVATDIAARGLDIDQLPQVVNFDLPDVPEDYVHRIGRTGRAGASGKALSLYSSDEAKKLRDIERLTGKTIERQIISGFEPGQTAPANEQQPERDEQNNRSRRRPAKAANGRQGSNANAQPRAAGNSNGTDKQPRRNKPANGQQPRRSNNPPASGKVAAGAQPKPNQRRRKPGTDRQRARAV